MAYSITSEPAAKKTFFEDIFPTKEVFFHDIKVSVPSNPQNILMLHYGKNYLKLPSLELRLGHFRSLEVAEDSPFYDLFDVIN